MFNLNNFIKSGLLAGVGHMADYSIILNAVGWFDKGVLTESDLAEIEAKIENKNNLPEVEEVIEWEV